MNDRCVSLLENYELEVLHTCKGRGAILCETDIGTVILKEYAGHREKCAYQDALLHALSEKGFSYKESIIRNKEGELLTEDVDGTCYILKTWFEGPECNARDLEDCACAMQTLASYHRSSALCQDLPKIRCLSDVEEEFEKHNRELRKIWRFLKTRSQKSNFEIALMQCYKEFFEKALAVTEEWKSCKGQEIPKRVVCHGDYQHHNLILSGNRFFLINFERCVPDSPVRDIYLFMRKLLEKSNWSFSTGSELLLSYERERPLEKEDYRMLYYRLSYPEKFWKIANFYYNSGKAWIPGKYQEKLSRVNRQEQEKKEFLKKFREKYGILTS